MVEKSTWVKQYMVDRGCTKQAAYAAWGRSQSESAPKPKMVTLGSIQQLTQIPVIPTMTVPQAVVQQMEISEDLEGRIAELEESVEEMARKWKALEKKMARGGQGLD